MIKVNGILVRHRAPNLYLHFQCKLCNYIPFSTIKEYRCGGGSVLCTEVHIEIFVFAGCLKSWRLSMRGTRAVWQARFRSCCRRSLIWMCSLSVLQLKTSDCRSTLRPLTSSSSMFCIWYFLHNLYYGTCKIILSFCLFRCFLISCMSCHIIWCLWTETCRCIRFVNTVWNSKGILYLNNFITRHLIFPMPSSL